jgi:hypothetical protein
MSKPVTHIIHKLNLDIEAPDSRMARKLYQQAGELLQQYVLPKLEELLKQYDKSDMHISLDQLDINLDDLNPSSFEDEIKSRLAGAIMSELERVVSRQKEQTKNDEEVHFSNHADRITEAFLWFLEHGTLPWWVAEKKDFINSSVIIDAIADDEVKFVMNFKKCLEHSPVALKRLLSQYDFSLLQYLISLVMSLESFSLLSDFLLRYEETFYNKTDILRIRQQYWEAVWTAVSLAELFEIKPEVLKDKLNKFIDLSGNQLLPVDLFSSDNKTINDYNEKDPSLAVMDKNDVAAKLKEEATLKEHEGLLGSNAGLVLLHPFLHYFFMEFGLLEGNIFKHEQAQGTAVHLLHYLATGEEHTPDFELLFEKYLCGMSFTTITNRHHKLTSAMKTEADVLLQSVIKHWSVLKNTSPEGLREGFLQRKGKLIVNSNGHKIIMERNTLDILLQQISWNISLVKLPWIDTLIHVEWDS